MFQSNFLCISYVPKGYTIVLMFNKLCSSKLLWLATQHVTPRYVCVIALHDVVWCVLNKSRVQLMGRFVICFKLCFKIGCVFLSKSCCYLNILYKYRWAATFLSNDSVYLICDLEYTEAILCQVNWTFATLLLCCRFFG